MTRRRHVQDERAPRTRALPGESLPEPPNWMAAALCAQADPELWFPDRGDNTMPAKRVCFGCPVRQACAAYIFEIDPGGQSVQGVWAGFSQYERREIARSTRRSA